MFFLFFFIEIWILAIEICLFSSSGGSIACNALVKEDLSFEFWDFFLKPSPQPTKTKIGIESLSQPEPIAISESDQNVPPDDNNCPLTRLVHFELPISGTLEVPIDKTYYHVYFQALEFSL